MTVIEALKSKVMYPLSDASMSAVLIDRGMGDGRGEYTAEVGLCRGFKGALADCLALVLQAWNVSEGGVSLSANDRTFIRARANALYGDLGEPVIKEAGPLVEIL